MEQWTVDDVVVFLERLELHALVPQIRANAVNGRDLQSLSDEELLRDLGMTRLQIKKIRSNMPNAEPTLRSPVIVMPATAQPTAAATAMPQPNMMRERTLADELAALNSQLQQVKGTATAYGNANSLLKRADGLLVNALQLLQKANVMGKVDVLTTLGRNRRNNRMLGAVAGVSKNRSYRDAGQMVNQAIDAVLQARAILPSMPNIRAQELRRFTSAVLDIMFDNIITDLRGQRIIQEGVRDVTSMQREIRIAQQWVDQWMRRMGEDQHKLVANIAVKTNELDKCRQGL